MSASNFKELKEHEGHNVVVVSYGDDHNIAIECEDCCEVLLDFDNTDEPEEVIPEEYGPLLTLRDELKYNHDIRWIDLETLIERDIESRNYLKDIVLKVNDITEKIQNRIVLTQMTTNIGVLKVEMDHEAKVIKLNLEKEGKIYPLTETIIHKDFMDNDMIITTGWTKNEETKLIQHYLK